ncbi:MAG: S8 family serine peptidase [Planctomycetota bacterium]|nr:S8 family serine peptidase [Planctomycetota bacterium]
MSPASQAVKWLRHLYGVVLKKEWLRNYRAQHPLGSRGSRVALETLEPRLLLTSTATAVELSSINLLWPEAGDVVVNPLNEQPYALAGDGILLGQWDQGDVRRTHYGFLSPEGDGRVTIKDGTTGLSWHATAVAGVMIAVGTGVAPLAGLWSFNSGDAAAELEANAGSLVASNHSYGPFLGLMPLDYYHDSSEYIWFGPGSVTDLLGAPGSVTIEDPTFGKYSETSGDFDRIAWEFPYHTIVSSAGNERRTYNSLEPLDETIYLNRMIQVGDTVFSSDGKQQITITSMETFFADPQMGFDTLMGDQSVSKNALVVGAVWLASDALPLYSANFSSWGPTDDGRLKPDLVVLGHNYNTPGITSDSDPNLNLQGTSFAAPTVTGTVGLLNELHMQIYGTPMRSDMVRAVLCHTADDLGSVGPDFVYGWGMLNAVVAADHVAASAIQGRS